MKTSLIFLSAFLTTAHSQNAWEFRGQLENTLWVSDDIPAGFLEFDDGALNAPQLSTSLNYQPDPRFLFHTTVQTDRGFDAGTAPDGDIRFDLLYLLYRPFGDTSLNIQVGKFGSVFGNWSEATRDSPFILAPLAYSSITGAGTKALGQLTGASVESRANAVGPTIHLNKEDWSPLIWGAAYSNGASIFGTLNEIDYAIEVKNTGIGSSPEEWRFGEGDFRDPLFSGRIGHRPNAAWNYGVSFSRGPYLDADSFDAININWERDDFNQTLTGIDVRWAHHDWIISGEAFFSEFERIGDNFLAFSYYLQARYKVAPGLSLAGRFGQTLSNEITAPSGESVPWSPDLLRAELALGWRITPDLSVQTQYTFTYVTNTFSAPDPHLFGTSISWDF